MKIGLCQSCGGMATQTCSVCNSTVCIKCNGRGGCKLCGGQKKV